MDKQTFVDRVVSLSPRLTSTALGIVHDTETAGDVVQEALLKLFLRRHELLQYRSIEAAAITTVRHLAIDWLRRQRYTADIAEAEVLMPTETIDKTEQKELSTILSAAIEALPRLQSITFRLKEVEGYEAEEIAELTGSSVDAVYNNLSRARCALRRKLASYQEMTGYGIRKNKTADISAK